MQLLMKKPVVKAGHPKFRRRGPLPQGSPADSRVETGEPAVQTPLSAPGRKEIGRLIRQCLRPHWPGAILACATVCAASALGLLPPLLVRGLIDRAMPAGLRLGSAAPILPYVLALAVLPVVGCLVGIFQQFLSTRISHGILSDLRVRIFRHVQRQSLSFFTGTSSGEISARISDDVAAIPFALTGAAPALLSSIVEIAGTLSILFCVSWPLAIAASATLPLFLLPMHRAGRRQSKLAEEAQEHQAGLLALIQDVLNIGGYMQMRLFNRDEDEARRFSAKHAELLRRRLKLAMASRRMGVMITLISSIGPAAIYCFGGMLVIQGRLTIGDVVAFVAYLTALYGPVSGLASLVMSLQETVGVLRRVVGLLGRAPQVEDLPGAAVLRQVRGEIEFRDVTFAYAAGGAPALERVSFRAAPGQLIALVGPSGAGKTTAAHLIPRFYDPQQGAVLIDGVDVRRVTQRSLLDQLAMVTQETYLFHGTIADNLLYARPDASPADVEAACRAANIHDVITRLPEGYDTLVGQRGARLSGGQRQRLAIARALLKNPRVLILDEATSALDSSSERKIQQALVPLMRGRTTIAIAHRLSTILAADLIVVLDQGRVVETGTHEQLIQRNGLYARLCREQFAAAAR